MKAIDLAEKISKTRYEFLSQSATAHIDSVDVFLSTKAYYSVLYDADVECYRFYSYFCDREPEFYGATLYHVITDNAICEVVIK